MSPTQSLGPGFARVLPGRALEEVNLGDLVMRKKLTDGRGSRVINVGGGEIDDLEKLGHELKTVFGDVEKMLVFGNLIHGMLSEGDGMGGTKMNLQ